MTCDFVTSGEFRRETNKTEGSCSEAQCIGKASKQGHLIVSLQFTLRRKLTHHKDVVAFENCLTKQNMKVARDVISVAEAQGSLVELDLVLMDEVSSIQLQTCPMEGIPKGWLGFLVCLRAVEVHMVVNFPGRLGIAQLS